MSVITSATLLLSDDARLSIQCRPSKTEWHGISALLDLADDPSHDGVTAPIQLLEDFEYTYEIDSAHDSYLLEPVEIFDPDDGSYGSGRLKPGRRTGTIHIEVRSGTGQQIGGGHIEVRARKLDYLSEYRWMLERIANEAGELLLQRFAAATTPLSPTTIGPARTLYQRFAFVQALLESDSFQQSMQLILHRPYVSYESELEDVRPEVGLRSGRYLARTLTRPGPRTRLRAGLTIGGLDTVPEQVPRIRHVESVDTAPNRFVKFALETWRTLAHQVAARLTAEGSPDRRGRREAEVLEERLDLLLNAQLFADVGPLEHFPVGNQVLQRREGYRDVFRGFVQAEAAAMVDWEGGDDVFSAGSRDVATLYEYWVFLELARIIESIGGFEMHRGQLVVETDRGLSLNLKRGGPSVIRGTGSRWGRRLELELWFNRTFPKGAAGSWTKSMRPDCSLRISPSGAFESDTTWLHFDAKYRVDQQLVGTDESEDAEGGDADEVWQSQALAEDLLKMHAYRDAIRRTSGAFVLYPGTDGDTTEPFRRYHEILPGLGAFVLRPSDTGETSGESASALRNFIEDVFDHVAVQGTSHERAGYWEHEAYQSPGDEVVRATDTLVRPPADTPVLIGYVKTSQHLNWIREGGWYNLRADTQRQGSVGLDSPEMGAEFLVLRGDLHGLPAVVTTSGSLAIRTRQELEATGYQSPGGETYALLEIDRWLEPHEHPPITGEDVEDLVERLGADIPAFGPIATTWLEVFGEIR